MKKNILAMGIAAAIAAPVAMAEAPTVYGQMNLGVTNVTNEGSSVIHRNSRLGIKGAKDLGNGLTAVYQLEGTVGQNNNYFGTLFDRNTFAGLAGGFGTVVMGRHDTPLRMIQPNDGFNDNVYLGNNTGNFNGFGGLVGGEHRLNNVIAYISPSFGGVQLAVAGTSTANSIDDQAINNGVSASIAYGSKRQGLYAAAAMTRVGEDHAALPAGVKADMQRVTVQFAEAGLVVSGMYNAAKVAGNKQGNSMTFGVAQKMGDLTPRAKVSRVSYENADNSTNVALGLDYALGKGTKIVAEVGRLDKNNQRGTDVGNKATTSTYLGLNMNF
ncbi:porin [Thiomicrospira microaerophila]|uniref:porin n=1 Tax=Thiomicrospira microaerophila TaxID=406020 RepID=UPI00200DE404|nr:porin [Thiomicrospira microaerophila]UQB42082.1 porin [Thiomicrospira microaerophila]